MPYKIQYNDDRNFIEVTFQGGMDMAAAKKYLEELYSLIGRTGCKRVLGDSRNSALHINSTDLMKLPRIMKESPLTKGLKQAVLAPKGFSGFDLYSDVSTSLGLPTKVFYDYDLALLWLLEDSTR